MQFHLYLSFVLNTKQLKLCRSSLFGEDFVARESISLRVVSTNAVWVADGLVGVVIAVRLVVEESLDIGWSEVTSETRLLILDFSSGKLIIVVKSGVIEELLVKNGLEKELEIAHETGVVTVLVLGEDGDETEGFLISDRVVSGRGREAKHELSSTEESDSVKSTSNAHLLESNHSQYTRRNRVS